MFVARRDRSRATIKRALTVLTLAAFVSTGLNFGVFAPRGGVAAAATPSVDLPAPHNDPPDGKGKAKKARPSDLLSAMGLAAQRAQAAAAHAQGKKFQGVDQDVCTDLDAECDDTFDPDASTPIVGGQAETSIAVDVTGQHIVVGFNDTRGFALSPTSVSGFMYSDNGGLTFSDGGLLPITVPQTTVAARQFPQAFGDPEVKYLGGSNFVYIEIMVKAISSIGTAQTMGFHRSTDYGHTWTGPFEIPSATNPHGLLSGPNARDAADKEFADVDPDTGRVLMSWSNFTPAAAGGVEISTTYSDNIMSGSPTWSARSIVGNTAADGQSSVPRFAKGSSNAYVAWRRFPGGTNQNVGFARSLDNGTTWQPTINLTANFFTADQILGNDRSNTSPSLAVDNSGGPNAGNVYAVYENNNNHDGGDISFQRSTDGGATWSAAMTINSRPGGDRSQWFPWVTVDSTTGRVGVFYYDQGIATSGDLTEVTYAYSNDGGTTWSRPAPISDRPFQAAWGNDTGQPNIGDYNQAVAQGGELFAVFAATESKGFTDGEPFSTSFTTPDVAFKRIGTAARASLRLGAIAFVESGGNGIIDPGETVTLTISLENYVTNPLSAGPLTGISATLTTSTPNVSIAQGSSAYPNIGSGSSAANTTAFVIQTSAAFVLGTKIELLLDVSTDQGVTTLRDGQLTGTPSATTFFSQDFNGVVPGTLPAGWLTSHGGGSNTVPWTTNATFCGATSNGIFHANANDGLSGNNTRFERLFSPIFAVPAGDYVTLDFDVCYDTEDDPAFNVLAYDGLTLRITDQTIGRILRSVLIDAFAEGYRTGSLAGFPKHLPRSSNAAYFPDMSVWAGFSGGMQHVSMRLPGMAGSSIQLRWEYTQDSVGTCADVRAGHACGVSVDNIVMKTVTSVPGTSVAITSPPNGSFTNQTSISVSGTEANATTVTVNSVAATITGSTWTATVPLPIDGVNAITATATGPTGSATASITVTRDTVAPAVTAPGDQIAEATSAAGAIVSYPACTAADLNGAPAISYTKASGTQFALGNTTVTCTATDVAGNAASASFTVRVVDRTPPAVTASPGATAEAASALGAVVSYLPCTATDAVSTPTFVYSQNSGTLFTLGRTAVTCTATDLAGNRATATFFVNVVDTTGPTITGTATPAANANGWRNVDVTVHFTCGDAVGIASCTADVTLSEGAGQSVIGTAVDTSGNRTTTTVSGINVDETRPTIAFSGDHAYLVDQTVVITCTASDALSGIETTSCPAVVNAPASSFAPGTHTVSASATDRAGNSYTKSTTFSAGVTFTSLCNLVQSKSSSAGIANSLCAKLSNASAAAARGNPNVASNVLDAYQHELRAQSGKAFSVADAALLARLADALR